MVKQRAEHITPLLRVFVGLAGFGAALALIGHGVLAVQRDAALVDLLDGTLRFLPGDEPAISTVGAWTQGIGVFDILTGVILGLLTVGLFLKYAEWRRLATSKIMLALLVWVVFWQFLTSASTIVATGDLQPGFWELLERSPSFVLPLGGLLAVLRLRIDEP